MPPLERTVHGLLDRQARRFGDDVFMHFGARTWSFESVRQASMRTAAAFQALGIGKGDHVAVMLANRPEYLFTWFGLSRVGAVEVPINPAHHGELLVYMLDQAECAALIVEQQFLSAFEAVRHRLPRLRAVVVLGAQAPAWPHCRTVLWSEAMSADGDVQGEAVTWSDPALVMFTSGTTGASKAAVLPHNYAICMAEIISEVARYTRADCLYNALPLFHGNAKVLSTLPALLSGARMVLAERFSAGQFWQEVRAYGCTEFNYIGSILAILLKAEPLPNDRDHPLRVMVGAGAGPGVFDAFERRFGVSLIECYGMSEIGVPLVSQLDNRRVGSCGRPHSDYDVRLVDERGLDVAGDVPGELLVRPRKPWSMMLRYHRMPEKTVEAWCNLWFHTGDYLKRDADGFYYFVDRKKDAIRRRGENISSFEVERLAAKHPDVLECAAVPVPSELGEDEVMVCVVPRPGRSVSAPELARHCAEQMAGFMVPRYFRILSELPKTPTARVQKYRLREQGITSDTWDRERAAASRMR